MKKRRLSEKQAAACENALNPRCRCRCGGALHGAKRGGEEVPARAFFEELADDDAHRITSAEELEDRRNLAQQIRAERAMLRRLEHDAKRLTELGSTRPAAVLEQYAAEKRKRIEWLRGRAHSG